MLKMINTKHIPYRSWSLDAWAKMRLYGDSIGTLADQFDYIYCRLCPKTQNMVASFYSQAASADCGAYPQALLHVPG